MTGIISGVTKARDAIVRVGRSLHDRGLAPGSSGNISVRLDDGSTLMTPTGYSLGTLEAGALAHLGADGAHLDGAKPTKEAFLHRTMYRQRGDARAVVHLHSTHSVAVSCMADVDPKSVLPPITAYFVMRVGTLPLVPYYPPGDETLADAVGAIATKHHAVLLANHGPVVAGKSLEDALYATEELEETAKLYLLLHGHRTRPLTDAQVAELRRRFG